MGKQVGFFMTKKDVNDFLKVVFEYKSLILDRSAVSLSLEEAQASNDKLLFFALPHTTLDKRSSGYINAMFAEVIEFSKWMVWMENEGVLQSGRIWAEFRYYGSNQEIITKSKQFSDMYNSIAKWIKKNYQLSKCKNYYVGNDAYKEYKEKKYVLMAGPKYIVEFE